MNEEKGWGRCPRQQPGQARTYFSKKYFYYVLGRGVSQDIFMKKIN